MATHNQDEASQGRDKTQREQTATGSSSGTSELSGRAPGVTRSDQERQRSVSREPGTQSSQRGTALSPRSRSGSMVPSIMAAPPGLLAGAFMSNPFEFMRRLNSEMDRLFESHLGGEVQESGIGATTWMPRIERFQRNNQLVVRAELPGLTRDDVTINVDEGTLEISGERRQDEEDQSDRSWWSERSYGSFYRAIPLPDGVNEDQITAKFEDGILNVTVPLPQQATRKAKKVEIH